MAEWRIVELGVGEVDLVEGLWGELRAHHVELTREHWPTRPPDDSWAMRRAKYVGWLESGEGTLFVVPGEGAEAAPLGYAMLRIGPSGQTWDLGEAVGDLETLSVTASARGAGVGSALIARCRERLLEAGARWWGVTAIAANERALELYEREGFRPFANSLIAPVRPDASI